jgi:hypothetical protein
MRRWTARGAVQGQDRAAAVPAATRQRAARYSDLRLWLGIVLLVGSTTAGYLVLSQGEDTVTVWRAARDLAPGTPPTALEPVAVSREVAGAGYARPGDTLVGRLRWPIPAGGLVPLAALDGEPRAGAREVTVPVDPLHAPVALQQGDIVDVWSMPRPDSAAAEGRAPVLVLPSAVVASLAADAVGIGGEIAVVLEVPTEAVGAVVAATRSGVLDLVAVPAGSAELAS